MNSPSSYISGLNRVNLTNEFTGRILATKEIPASLEKFKKFAKCLQGKLLLIIYIILI
jgi:hypothetical protein